MSDKFNYEDLEFHQSFDWSNRSANTTRSPNDNWKRFSQQSLYVYAPGDEASFTGNYYEGTPVHRAIGTAQWGTHTGELHWIQTSPQHQRRGVATHALRKARELQAAHGLPDIIHTGVRYPEGTAWAKSTGLYVPPIKSGVCRECNQLRSVDGYCKCAPNFNTL